MDYWNKIFQPNEPLNANFVKALIATESSFDPDPKRIKTAHGLMQIKDVTIKILGDEKGELKNHFIHLTNRTVMDSSANICAGIRWLFRKKEIASSRVRT